jgi:Flp pilus assembly protein TadD
MDRAALAVLAGYSLLILAVLLIAHRTPLYGVETDLVGDYIPAARELRAGHFDPGHFAFRGPGYPLLLALLSYGTGADFYLAARLLNAAAAAAAGWFAFRLIRGFLGPRVALASLIALLATPVFVRAAIECGTDMPALALALAATGLVAAASASGRGSTLIAAGAVAGYAAITRYNALVLLPAALCVFLRPPGRTRESSASAGGPWRRAALYSIAFAVPVGAWILAQVAGHKGALENGNYINIAFEFYGRNTSWELFWLEAAPKFHSFAEVFRYDPARFVTHLAMNLATRWWTDAHLLLPVWIGAIAVPGMVLSWWRRPGVWLMTVHFLLGYAVLCLTFYAPRFFLYLIPFYLSGAFGLLLGPPLFAPSPSLFPEAARRGLQRAAPVIAAILIGFSAWAAFRDTGSALAGAPDETRHGGELLRRVGVSGEAVMARKPHVAYFGDMRFVPLPDVDTFAELFAAARQTGARYLFISTIEASYRIQFSILAAPDVTLPGLERIPHPIAGPADHYALFRFTGARVPDAELQDSLLAVTRRFISSSPDDGRARMYLGGQLVMMGRYREALPELDRAEQLTPDDAVVARMQALAHIELGEYDDAAAACERALRLRNDNPWALAVLGHIRIAQGRFAEAQGLLRQATERAPAQQDYQAELGRAYFFAGDWRNATRVFEHLVTVNPGDPTARRFAALAWLKLGRPDRARELASPARRLSGADAAALVALADSLAAH